MEGVLGHEVAHVANGDMVTMTLVQGVVNAFVMFLARAIAIVLSQAGRRDGEGSPHMNYMIVFVLEMVFSFLGMFVVTWFSRYREYRADAGAAVLSSRSNMIAALQRLAVNKGLVDNSQPQLATMINHGSKGKGLLALMSTHPPLEERIAALRPVPSSGSNTGSEPSPFRF